MMVLMHVPDEIGHRRSRSLDKFVGNSPHLLESAVDDFAAQIRPHEEHRIVDRLQNRIKLIKQNTTFGKGRFSKLSSLLRRLFAALQIGNVKVSEQPTTVWQRLNPKMNDAAISET